MEEKQVETQRKPRFLLMLAGVLLVGLFGVGLVLASQAFAQDDPVAQGNPVATDEPVIEQHQLDRVLDHVMVGSTGAIAIHSTIGPGFPFERALHKLVAEGVLTLEDVDSIMSDLSGLSDAVDFTATTSPDGQTKEVELSISIQSDDSDLPAAMQQALDNAVANGLLTAEQAAAVLAEVEATPDPILSMVPGTAMAFSVASPITAGDLLDGPFGLGQRLDDAVTAGTITADEAQVFRDILTKLLAATE